MKRIGISILALMPLLSFGQGIIAPVPNSLITVRQSGTTDPNLKVGIGVSAPTDHLHVKGTVRFETIPQDNSLGQVLVKSSNGVDKGRRG